MANGKTYSMMAFDGDFQILGQDIGSRCSQGCDFRQSLTTRSVIRPNLIFGPLTLRSPGTGPLLLLLPSQGSLTDRETFWLVVFRLMGELLW